MARGEVLGLTTQGVRYIVEQLRKRAGAEWSVIPHRLRAWFATHLLGSEVNPAEVQDLMGHESANTTRIFLGDRYVVQRYRLRAWFAESDYRRIGEDPALLRRAVANPETRDRLWRCPLYREPLKPSSSTDFLVFVRRDLAGGFRDGVPDGQ